MKNKSYPVCPGCGKPVQRSSLERTPTAMLDYSRRIWHKACAQQVLAKFQEIETQLTVLRNVAKVTLQDFTNDCLNECGYSLGHGEDCQNCYRGKLIKRLEAVIASSAGHDMLEIKVTDKKFQELDAQITHLLKTLANVWNQFAYRTKIGGLMSGYLSTLECVEEILREHNLLDEKGCVKWEALATLEGGGQSDNRRDG